MPIIFLHSIDTPVGPFHLLIELEKNSSQQIVVASGFGARDNFMCTYRHFNYSEEKMNERSLSVYNKAFDEYFSGNYQALAKISYRQSGTGFQNRVWDTLEKIPFGQTCSYGDIASKTGSGKAARAVGSACAANSLVLLIPCHRVIQKNGQLGNYRYGVSIKNFLYHHERLHTTS